MRYIFLLATLLTALPASAQTVVTPLYRLYWDQPNVNTGGTFTWESSVDSSTGPFAPVLSVTCTGTPTANCNGSLPQSLTTGRHTLYLRTVRTLDTVRYISPEPYPSVAFDYLSNATPDNPQNIRPALPPNSASVSVLGTVLYRGFAFGQDVATNALDGVPNFPFYFGASNLDAGGAYGAPRSGDRFYLVLWRPIRTGLLQ